MVKALSIPLLVTAAHALSMPMADPSSLRSTNFQKDFKGGAGVGRLVFEGDDVSVDKWRCKYDMVLVERLQDRPKTDSGLFVPRENLPKLHLCRGEFLRCYMCARDVCARCGDSLCFLTRLAATNGFNGDEINNMKQ